MNTTFEVHLVETRAEYARQASVAVFAEIDRLESLLSKFDPRSDIAQINRLHPGQSHTLSIDVLECLSLAAQIYTDTHGAFDVTFSPGRTHSAMDWLVLGDISAGDNFVGVRPPIPGEEFLPFEINLGGIGKGYALDKTRDILNDWGIGNALLHSGTSSVLALGSAPGTNGWPIGIAGDYKQLAGISEISLLDSALGSSGTEVKGEHILDPRTGLTASGHLATWVRADTAAEADAISTALMIMCPEEAAAFLESRPNVSAVLIANQHGKPTANKFGSWTYADVMF